MNQMTTFLPSPVEAKLWCGEQSAAGRQIGFVATMGALHEGHLALVRRAKAENDRICVSVFVNPLQFNEEADYQAYPKNLEADLHQLNEEHCDMVFSGTKAEFLGNYGGTSGIELLSAGQFGQGLEGVYRPGHLDGVRTIVHRLFLTVGRCWAYFGEKDFQQTLVVNDLAWEMGYPKIIVCPTIRDDSGLALSSRNALLTDKDRAAAAVIYRALLTTKQRWGDGIRDAEELSICMHAALSHPALDVEYAEVRDPEAWTANGQAFPLPRGQALIAARIGQVRLIDNLRLDQ